MRKYLVFAILGITILLSGCMANIVTYMEKDTSTDAPVPTETNTESDVTEEATEEIVNIVNIDYPKTGDELIDDLIEDCINDFDVIKQYGLTFDKSSYTVGKHEVLWHTEDIFSVKIQGDFYVLEYPHTTSFCYGLSIDLKKARVVMFDEVVPDIEYIIDAVLNGEYEVEYGVFGYMTEEEIVQEVAEYFDTKEFRKCMNNFYMDENYVYVIIDDVIGSEYSVLKLNKN